MILAVGSNYAKHVQEMGSARPAEPIWFWKPETSIIADGDAVIVPDGIGEVHHEVELAVRVGKRAKNVSVAEAISHLDAYTAAVDVTARTLQTAAKNAGKPWAQAKGFDTFLPLGQPVPLPDDLQTLPLELRIDGQLRQQGTTADMTWSVAELVSLASRWTTLVPGQWVLTGTPDGVGPIKPGQMMDARVGDATIRNPIA